MFATSCARGILALTGLAQQDGESESHEAMSVLHSAHSRWKQPASQSHPRCKRPMCGGGIPHLSHVARGQVKPKCEAGTTVPAS
jgi:hypothetical protein